MLIQVENLNKTFVSRKRKAGLWGSIVGLFSGKKEYIHAVKDISFSIGRGELVGYLGPNGAGKSTTIKMLTGILRASSGLIRIDGLDPEKHRKEITRKLGVVFGQKTQLWWDLPVEESYDLLRTIYRIPQKEFRDRMDYFIDLLKMEDFLGQQTRKLSLGQRMRADLAASLLHNPPILFLDEPTIGLDIITKDVVRKTIKQLNQEQKITVVLTTHDMEDIEYLATRLILLDRGQVQYDGQLNDFIANYQKEKIVSLHLEQETDVRSLQSKGFELASPSNGQFLEVRLKVDESVSGLIGALSEQGARIQEITVGKQDLTETLKKIYAGKNLEL
ncbi:MAG: ATP-binding cassette domain-containing protein [Leptospiraceae bacterium]|nr:ATP-binding cassette domain-containing protein [Leptospiraceae bacterium]MCB1302965.1 ATP-binding cassette domain-containing protein [Leptospiraceae bacterium]